MEGRVECRKRVTARGLARLAAVVVLPDLPPDCRAARPSDALALSGICEKSGNSSDIASPTEAEEDDVGEYEVESPTAEGPAAGDVSEIVRAFKSSPAAALERANGRGESSMIGIR